MDKNTAFLVATGTDDYYAVESILENITCQKTLFTGFIYSCRGSDLALISLLAHSNKFKLSQDNNEALYETVERIDKNGTKIVDFLMTFSEIREAINQDFYSKINNKNHLKYVREKLLKEKIKDF